MMKVYDDGYIPVSEAEKMQYMDFNSTQVIDATKAFDIARTQPLYALETIQYDSGLAEKAKTQLSYWDKITLLNNKQEAKGVNKYGEMLEENTTLSRLQRIEHAQEEAIDFLKYLEHLKETYKDNLTANDYQRQAMRTVRFLHESNQNLNMKQLREAVYGLNGEAGEIIDLLKKHEFQDHELNKESLIDELGDVLWYAALMATALNTKLEDVMVKNIEKLKKRYPDGFDKNRSINRDETGPGGAHHEYGVFDSKNAEVMQNIFFQEGSRKDPIKEALMLMNRRVEDRIERQVLGTMQQ